MALHTDTQIFKSTRDLLLMIEQYVANMDRIFKPTIGADLRADTRRIIRCIKRANMPGNRVAAINEMREWIDMVNLSLYECVELRQISRPQYAKSLLLVEGIGKQATGWLKHSEKALVAPSSRRSGQRA